MADAHAFGRLRQAVHTDRAFGDVQQTTILLDIEMAVVRRVGVEVRPRAVDRQLAHETGPLELMQGVIDSRKRDALAARDGLRVQDFRRYVASMIGEQKPAKREALARWAQSGPAQQSRHLAFAQWLA